MAQMSLASRKMLTVLLVLLMGISPIQGTLAGFVGAAMHDPVADHQGHALANAGDNHCDTIDEKPSTDRFPCCQGNGCVMASPCGTSHCGASATVILSRSVFPDALRAASVLTSDSADFSSLVLTPLFRPPRA